MSGNTCDRYCIELVLWCGLVCSVCPFTHWHWLFKWIYGFFIRKSYYYFLLSSHLNYCWAQNNCIFRVCALSLRARLLWIFSLDVWKFIFCFKALNRYLVLNSGFLKALWKNDSILGFSSERERGRERERTTTHSGIQTIGLTSKSIRHNY